MVDWPHSPAHRLGESGAYIVTAATYQKAHHFRTPERLTFLQETLFRLARQYSWHLQAWAIMANHYHFVAMPTASAASNLPKMISHLHSVTARELNSLDGALGRRVWFQYWDTHLTYQSSYYARLNYVHQNPVHHRLVPLATEYPWCSAAWFERTTEKSFFQMVTGFKTDRVSMFDDFNL